MTVVDGRGLPLFCETEGCGWLASSVWTDTLGRQQRVCATHNPWSYARPHPLNFTSRALCHACGQPMQVATVPAS